MIKYLIYILLFPVGLIAQNISFATVGVQDMSGIEVEVEHEVISTNGIMDVRIFRTHYGNGNTSQYKQYPSTRSEMDRLFNSAYAATTLWWTGTLPASRALAFTNYTTLTSGGASVPSNANYYSLEATCTFVPTETGTYWFRMTSDDGSDLQIGSTSVIEWYGGKGVGQYRYGSIYLAAGQQYYFKARMQEYAGGDGLIVQWRKPSGGNYALWTNEIGVSSSSWVSQGIQTTTSSGTLSFSNLNNYSYRVKVDVSKMQSYIGVNEMNYLMYMRMFTNEMRSWDFHTCDFNGDMIVGYEDVKEIWNHYDSGDPITENAVYSQSEKDDIEVNALTFKYHEKYPRSPIRTFEDLNRFYIVSLGKHRKSSPNKKIN